MTVPGRLAVAGLVLLVGGLSLAVAVPADGLFRFEDPSEVLLEGGTGTAALVMLGEGNLIMLGWPQLIGYGTALIGLLVLTLAAGYGLGRRGDRLL